MNVQRRNKDVSIYCLSSGPVLPEWIGERARRNLSKKDENIRRRIELIQDFQMPASSSKIVQSTGDGGRYIIVAGIYPPRIRCYDVHDLSLKFERSCDASVLDMQLLGEDYGKMALLLDDRTIAFHAPYGFHESIRIPTFGRAMAYEPSNCELLLAAKGTDIFRVNLQEGRFRQPWTMQMNESPDISSSTSAVCIAVHPTRPLATVGCEDGIVRFWDCRVSDSMLKPFLQLDVASATRGYGFADYNEQSNFGGGVHPGEITSVANDSNGLYTAVGTAGGLVALYDVRSSRPLHIQEHKDGLPIHTVKFHANSGMILSSDEKLIKVWRYRSSSSTPSIDTQNTAIPDATSDPSAIGSVMVNIEGTGKLAHFIVSADEKDPTADKCGVVLCATDQPKMESYYVPALGTAPRWCSFLENITEELEERDLEREGLGGSASGASDLVRDGKESIYENYKFVSREDVEQLGISNLVGSPLLKGYMHGFFMDINLYNRVKAVANPFEYEEYQKKKLKERMEAKRASRIAPRESDKRNKSTTKVNPDLAERLGSKAGDSTKAGKAANEVLSDSRFGGLFTNPDFEIEEDNEYFKLRNPSGIAAARRRKNNMDSDEEDEDMGGSDNENDNAKETVDNSVSEGSEGDSASDEESDSDEDGFRGGKVRGEAYDLMKKLNRKKDRQSTSSKHQAKKKKVQMYAAEELEGDDAVDLGLGQDNAEQRTRRRLDELNMPLAKRFAMQNLSSSGDDDNLTSSFQRHIEVRVQGGSKEAKFIPRDTLKKMEKEKLEQEEQMKEKEKGKRKRRGIKELGLKNPVQPTSFGKRR